MSKSLDWDSLNYELLPWIKNAIEVMGYDQMTPVQASTIPMFVGNKDVVVDSVTGSGKTVAFVIPILEKIVKEATHLKKGHFHSLIISPTRELSRQIQTVINSFLQHYPDSETKPIKSQLLVGTDTKTIRDDVASFLEERPSILVGTPGRVLDFLQIASVKAQLCSMVVLDEADRLLDISFSKDIEKILSFLPKQRRTGLFSATITSAGSNIFKTGLRNPVKIKVNSKNNSPTSLSLNYCVVDTHDKLIHLLNLLNNYRFKKCIVYFPTCISVTFFYGFIQYLQKQNNSVLTIDESLQFYSLHGKLQTSSRIKTLEAFTEDLNNSVLFTTDVAARGIDIPDVDLVIQLDPPTDSDIFMHRCGRTGRANKIGKAITFINSGREEDFIPFMEVKNVTLEPMNEVLKEISEETSNNFYDLFKKWILQDRARFDLSIKSYVAFIRHYSNHTASSIFRLQNFSYTGLAKMYGLIRIPRMPEVTKYLQKSDVLEVYDDGWLVTPPIDLNKFSYADKKREQARLQELENLRKIQDKKKLKFDLKKKNMAWSNKVATKESKSIRREKMSLKRKLIEEELANQSSSDDDDNIVTQDWKEEIMQNKRKKKDTGIQGSFDDL
ncbi:hypothetical protein KAFR_0D01120 [Kazachstania africana CBS 2517]|uniref:ATP-dependent RNA helicase n=1 Tax=Kazachstania africana (strain ATCC 22294 / BCRC 22015 / CBS 2517 / CECT 1963 / NBRC 1671 / NRRL Y-8276) TaxID=1071382 RepID=H2ATQ8_KAZAF|nr:hypothetical protein KAFR_0D01120 [Kazachstania africana CBS 2517]CCF57758.1 hypothetical protein KAFR_0D01120 [Kazachstania africana CBS 2517]